MIGAPGTMLARPGNEFALNLPKPESRSLMDEAGVGVGDGLGRGAG